jgi:hypothetical protein
VQVLAGGVIIYTGFVTDWDLDYGYTTNANVTTVACADAFTVLANQSMNAVTPSAESSSARVAYVLTRPEVAYQGPYSAGTGSSTLGAFPITEGTNVLTYLQNVATSEQGYLFIASNGTLTFSGRSESRWMDEHIKLDGQSLNLSGAIIDNNLQSLEWWRAKHENYAKREAVDLLNLKYHFSVSDSVASQAVVSQLSLKRKIKEKIYARLPKGLRSIAYFMYRYILLGGFLDDANGRSFHRLQGYWYRNLADRNVAQVERYKQEHGVDIKTAITHVLGISV